ncbi:uncharacterized protein LOC135846490 [Planococcus citri]|uniref:uncharacterized protein LOC135846490 n=1 Tax=Planococcus citri TaxID=170843 RepID=UPI0031F87EC6
MNNPPNPSTTTCAKCGHLLTIYNSEMTYQSTCGHFFHHRCFRTLITTNLARPHFCPCCNASITADSFRPVQATLTLRPDPRMETNVQTSVRRDILQTQLNSLSSEYAMLKTQMLELSAKYTFAISNIAPAPQMAPPRTNFPTPCIPPMPHAIPPPQINLPTPGTLQIQTPSRPTLHSDQTILPPAVRIRSNPISHQPLVQPLMHSTQSEFGDFAHDEEQPKLKKGTSAEKGEYHRKYRHRYGISSAALKPYYPLNSYPYYFTAAGFEIKKHEYVTAFFAYTVFLMGDGHITAIVELLEKGKPYDDEQDFNLYRRDLLLSDLIRYLRTFEVLPSRIMLSIGHFDIACNTTPGKFTALMNKLCILLQRHHVEELIIVPLLPHPRSTSTYRSFTAIRDVLDFDWGPLFGGRVTRIPQLFRSVVTRPPFLDAIGPFYPPLAYKETLKAIREQYIPETKKKSKTENSGNESTTSAGAPDSSAEQETLSSPENMESNDATESSTPGQFDNAMEEETIIETSLGPSSQPATHIVLMPEQLAAITAKAKEIAKKLIAKEEAARKLAKETLEKRRRKRVIIRKQRLREQYAARKKAEKLAANDVTINHLVRDENATDQAAAPPPMMIDLTQSPAHVLEAIAVTTRTDPLSEKRTN